MNDTCHYSNTNPNPKPSLGMAALFNSHLQGSLVVCLEWVEEMNTPVHGEGVCVRV